MSNNKILNFLYVITACGIGGFATWDKFFNYQKTNNGLAYKIVKPGDKNSTCKEEQFVFFEKTISFKDVVKLLIVHITVPEILLEYFPVADNKT